MTNRASSPRSSLIPPSATAPSPTLSISKAQAALTLADLLYVTFGGLQGNLYSVFFILTFKLYKVYNSVLVFLFHKLPQCEGLLHARAKHTHTHTAGADAIRSN